ncbi:hypothetical protein [Dactylosporangium sp. NPDC048998]|uniref:hypothetical protein n=1 Tax=Dactylosporangium sp. NPDC048998 TaxID=3363976 RepID=UPI003720FDEE
MSRLFRLLENLVDPFDQHDLSTPPSGARAFLFRELRPLRGVIIVLTVVGAGIEVWLIGYAGHLVDTLAATSPARLWQSHGAELVAVALLVLIVRPLVHLVSEGLDDIAFRPNALTLAL